MKNKPAPLLNPGTLQPYDRPGAWRRVLRRAGGAGTGQRPHPTFPFPEEILDFYKMYRPSPLVRAYCLEEKLQTPAKIYYKFEGNNTSGSHKLNSAIAQAYYAKTPGSEGRHHRDRRRPVGHRPVHGLRLSGPGLQGVHGQGAPMSRSPSAGRSCAPTAPSVTPSPSIDHRGGPEDPGSSIPAPPAAWAAPSPRPWRRPPPPPATAMCWAACSTRCCSTSPSSAWRPRPPWTNTA